MSDPTAPSEASEDEILAEAIGGVGGSPQLLPEGEGQWNGSVAGHNDVCTCELCWP